MRIDDHQRLGQPIHVPDAGEVAVDLGPLAGERRDHLLRVAGRLFAVEDRFQFFQSFQPTADRPEVRQRAAEPALGHIRHPTAGRFFNDRLGRLPLRSHEQDQAVLRGHPVEELAGAEQSPDGFFQVNDMNQVALAVNIRLHLRVPAARAMSEMNARIDQVFHNDGHSQHLPRFNDDSGPITLQTRCPGRPCWRKVDHPRDKPSPSVAAGRPAVKSRAEALRPSGG